MTAPKKEVTYDKLIMAHLREATGPVTARMLADQLQVDVNLASAYLSKLHDLGQLERTGSRGGPHGRRGFEYTLASGIPPVVEGVNPAMKHMVKLFRKNGLKLREFCAKHSLDRKDFQGALSQVPKRERKRLKKQGPVTPRVVVPPPPVSNVLNVVEVPRHDPLPAVHDTVTVTYAGKQLTGSAVDIKRLLDL